MVLKAIAVFLSLVFEMSFCNENGSKSEYGNFYYSAELVLKDDSGIFDKLTDVISESKIKTEIEKLKTFSMQDKPIHSMSALIDRVNSDTEILYKNLHFFGFYNASVSHKIRTKGSVHVVFTVDLKNKFALRTFLKVTDQDARFNEDFSELCREPFTNKSASMVSIRKVIDTALSMLKNRGFYNPIATKKKVSVDYEKEEARLDLEIECGKNVNFAPTRIVAFDGISHDFIRNRLNWTDGEQFSADKVQSSIEDLKNTQIFSNVVIAPIEDEIKDGAIPMLVRVEEDKKHILAFSLMYAGVRNMNFDKKSQAQKGLKSLITRVSWSRVNAFGNGEKLSVNAEGTPMKTGDRRIDYAFETVLLQPDVFLRNDSMEYGVSRRQELTNVYFKKFDRISLLYGYPLSDLLYSDFGITIEDNYVDSSEVFFRNSHMQKYYKNVTVPVSLSLDTTDDTLNPTSGYKIATKFAFTKLSKSAVSSLKSYGVSCLYNYAMDEDGKSVLAFYVARRGIFNGDIDNIPVDKRIFAGGLNSVRGFAHQMAAEMISGEDAIMGGKSSLELSCEMRRKIKHDWGIATFADGAKIYGNKSRYFEIEKKRWFFSVGAGVRYYTSIGPIRLDFAFPIRRRRGVDSKMQFIMSLGQAF